MVTCDGYTIQFPHILLLTIDLLNSPFTFLLLRCSTFVLLIFVSEPEDCWAVTDAKLTSASALAASAEQTDHFNVRYFSLDLRPGTSFLWEESITFDTSFAHHCYSWPLPTILNLTIWLSQPYWDTQTLRQINSGGLHFPNTSRLLYRSVLSPHPRLRKLFAPIMAYYYNLKTGFDGRF